MPQLAVIPGGSPARPAPDRLPPQDLEAEMATLGSALMSATAAEKVLEQLQRRDFYFEGHRKVFDALGALAERQIPADLRTLAQELERAMELDAVGGVAFLNQLADSVPTAAHVEYYLTRVREQSRRRQLIEACQVVLADAYDPGKEVDDLLNDAEQRMFGLAAGRESQEPQPACALMTETTDAIFYETEQPLLRTGLATLDHLIEGLERGDLVILAGRPSMGKSDLGCVQLPLTWAVAGVKVAIFSLEMPRVQLGRRLLAHMADVDSLELRRKNAGHADPMGVRIAANRLRDLPLWVQDAERMPSTSILALRAQMRRMVRKYGIQVFVIDQLQTIDEAIGAENENQALTEVVYRLQRITKALGVRTVLQCQLNRRCEERPNKRPFLSDLRSSGSIEQAADHVWLLYRDAYYRRDTTAPNPTGDDEEEVEIIVAKSRNARTGTARVRARLSRSWWWCDP